ncbi:MAG TPA: hypothetical protein VF970_02535 [Gemmatimonadales bacterium]
MSRPVAGGKDSMSDQVYDPARAARLAVLLRALATRITQLRTDAEMLQAGPELLRMMGDARSELFHYEVRATYDSPETAEHRRIVREAGEQADALRFDTEDDGDVPWRAREV